MEQQVAIRLKQSWGQIRLAALQAGKSLADNPTDEEFQQMAVQLIDQRSLSIRGQNLSIDELDRAVPDAMKQQLQISSFNQLIPNRNQVNRIADSVGDGVGQNTGPIMGASIGSAFRGLIKWVFSGMRGGFQGLKDTIAGMVGGNMNNAVQRNLARLRNELAGTPDDISGFMTNTAINGIGTEIQNTVLRRVNPNAPIQDSGMPSDISQVQMDDMGGIRTQARAVMRDTFRTEILSGLRQNEIFRDALPADLGAPDPGIISSATTGIASMLGLDSSKRREAATNIADRVSDRLSQIATDPTYTYQGADAHLAGLRGKKLTEMSPQDRARVMGAEAKAAVTQLANESTDPNMKLLYTGVAAEMQTKIEEAVLRRDAQIPWFIAGNAVNPNAPTLSTAPPRTNMLDMIAGMNATQINGLMRPMIGQRLANTTPEGRELEQLAGKPLESAHMDQISATVSGALEGIARDRATITAMPDGGYEETSRRIREALRRDRARINNGNGAATNTLALTDAALDAGADEMTLQLLGNQNVPASFQAAMTNRRNIATTGAISSTIQTGLRAKGAELSMAARMASNGQLQDSHYQALGNSASTALSGYVTNPQQLTEMGDNVYARVSDRIYQQLLADRGTINANGANFSDQALASMADEMAVQFVQNRMGSSAPALATPASPPVPGAPVPTVSPTVAEFNTNRTRRRREAVEMTVSHQVRTSLQSQATTIQAMGNSPNALNAANFSAISGTVTPVMSEYIANPDSVRAMGGEAYQRIADRIRDELISQKRNINVNGLNLSDADLTAMADTMAIQTVDAALGSNANGAVGLPRRGPGVDPAVQAFVDASGNRARAVASRVVPQQVQASLLANNTKLLAGAVTMTPPPTNEQQAALRAAIGSAVTPTLVNFAADPNQLAAMGPDVYARVSEQIRTQLRANAANINQNGYSFTPQMLDSMADQMAVESVGNMMGGNAPPLTGANLPPQIAAFNRDRAQRETAAITSVVRPQIVAGLGATQNRELVAALNMMNNRVSMNQGGVADVATATIAEYIRTHPEYQTMNRGQVQREVTAALNTALANSQGQTNIQNPNVAQRLADSIGGQFAANIRGGSSAGLVTAPPINLDRMVNNAVTNGVNGTVAEYRPIIRGAINSINPLPVGTDTLTDSAVNLVNRDLLASTISGAITQTLRQSDFNSLTPDQKNERMRANVRAALDANYDSIYPNGVYTEVYNPFGPNGRIDISLTPDWVRNRVLNMTTDKVMDAVNSGDLNVAMGGAAPGAPGGNAYAMGTGGNPANLPRLPGMPGGVVVS